MDHISSTPLSSNPFPSVPLVLSDSPKSQREELKKNDEKEETTTRVNSFAKLIQRIPGSNKHFDRKVKKETSFIKKDKKEENQAASSPKIKKALFIKKDKKEEKEETSSSKSEKQAWNKARPQFNERSHEEGFFFYQQERGSRLEASLSLKRLELMSRKSEQKIECSSLSSHQSGFSLDTLGLSPPSRTVLSHLQTKVFHHLKLENLVHSSSEKLDNISFDLKSLNQPVLASQTFQDPKVFYLEEEINPGQIDPSFLYLQQMEKSITADSTKIGTSFINTYPRSNSTAQMNCDAFHVELHPDYAFSVVADGCSWGRLSREAAQRAVAAVTQFINQMLSQSAQPIQTASVLAHILVQSLAKAHEAIVSHKKEVMDIGTTTINICFVFTDSKNKKYVMMVGLGDCQTFLVTKDTKNLYQAQNVTPSQRLGFDARDPGGRLGPYVGNESIDPDLRNLSVSCIALPSDDFIILNMTDGVADNLNPEQMGKKPCEVDSKIPIHETWSDLLASNRSDLVNSYQNQLLSQLINEAVLANQDASLNTMCECITSHCYKLTAYGREYMENYPQKREPADKKENPGKMDHATVVAFRI